ncbi:aspartate/glutamate racemase family protein [Salinigranum halophilum]|uniref:aspartate/glutamate racemase family protein n=1 Tax=Salinigranum halophilum TaxID=2565931 RepID=UPI001F02CC93|nr:aspartate/glutamate racemase family protein [Salinigranum halophilum]
MTGTETIIELGVLRVLTLENETDVALHGRVIEKHFPHVSTRSRCIPNHPNGIPSAEAEVDALPYILELGTEMGAQVDALAISCALDPGVSKLDERLDVPVIGAGASVAGSALARGRNVGTLGLEDGTPSVIKDILGDYLQATETVKGAETTNYLTTPEGRAATGDAITRLIEAGCDVVAPSCTGLTTSGVLTNVQRRADIPIVDPVVAMGAMAATAARPGGQTTDQTSTRHEHP